jgi:RNA polymerase sigma-70 factor (ECF subfamily)
VNERKERSVTELSMADGSPFAGADRHGRGRRSELDRDFDEFYVAHVRSLVLQLAAYTGDPAEAQDMVHEAFCRAFARWRTVGSYDDPAAWVRRVAWNLATNRFRSQRAFRSFLRRHRVEHVEGPGPDGVALEVALATLAENHRRAVVLHYLAGLSVGEIARQEGVPQGTVKSWLHRGRAALAGQLTDAYQGGRDD